MTGRSASDGARPIRAGALYFSVVFAIGFALALVRDGLLQLGKTEATRLLGALVEIPIVLLAAWFASKAITRACRVPARVRARVLMGATAFGLLMLAEIGTGVLLLGRSLSAHFALYLMPSYAIGLLAQIAFATFPWVQGRMERQAEPAATAPSGLAAPRSSSAQGEPR
jgi:uncharacterized membrane protein